MKSIFHEKNISFFFLENARNIFCLRKPVIKCVTRRVSNNVALLLKRGIALHSGLKDLRKKMPKILVPLTVL